ncbi:MAG: hypothetical protein KDB44_08960 [Mycobacterium sp.]|nr:hypothetical protein [Mycobacterium sp.]
MSGQRAQPAIPADHRSAHPNFPGVPWWGAVLIAVVSATLGFAFNAGSGGKELTGVFSALYALGCLGAVLAVRQAAVFTAVIQPPLILFVMVPGAYYLMHSSDIHGIKDVLINCGYPLIERFPLMFFTSAAVLLIGVARWYLGASSQDSAPAADPTPATGGGLAAKLTSLLGKASDASGRDPRRRHSVDRRPNDGPKATAGREARGRRPAKRAGGAPSRSRHARPPRTEFTEPAMDADRPRRRRPRPNEPSPAAEPRRPGRGSSQRDPRRAVPPSERRAAHDRAEWREPPPSGRRYEDYEPREPHRRTGNGSHHPVSRVRYRGSGDPDDQPEYRPRRRAPRNAKPDRWEYDI